MSNSISDGFARTDGYDIVDQEEIEEFINEIAGPDVNISRVDIDSYQVFPINMDLAVGLLGICSLSLFHFFR